MAIGFLSPIGSPTQQWFSDQGVILSGGFIYTYLAGTTTPAPTFTGPNLAVANPNPIVLNSSGRPPQEVWLQQSVQYKFVITDANNNPLSVGTFDNISGINDVAGGGGGGGSPASEWVVSSLTPTFVDGTHFTVPGNQTTTFTVNRRVYATVTAGTIYGSITASSFSSNTSVTVLWDSGALDSGLSSVAYALLNAVNPSIPVNESAYKGLLAVQVITATGALVTTKGANRAKIKMVAGAGAGGGMPNTFTNFAGGAGGGSPGSLIEVWVSSGWQTYNGTTLTIGAAGLGVTNANGGDGGDTTFGAFIIAPKGRGGLLGNTSSTSGSIQLVITGVEGVAASIPTSSIGQILKLNTGAPAAYGLYGQNSNISSVRGGNGGFQETGIPGLGAQVNGANGGSASGFGCGGGGATSYQSNGTTYKGGDATPGIMILEEYL